jgi:hypothetical protein
MAESNKFSVRYSTAVLLKIIQGMKIPDWDMEVPFTSVRY